MLTAISFVHSVSQVQLSDTRRTRLGLVSFVSPTHAGIKHQKPAPRSSAADSEVRWAMRERLRLISSDCTVP